jgi:hypothetical protein
MAASLAERIAQDVQFWMPGILTGAESKPARNGSARVLQSFSITQRAAVDRFTPPPTPACSRAV